MSNITKLPNANNQKSHNLAKHKIAKIFAKHIQPVLNKHQIQELTLTMQCPYPDCEDITYLYVQRKIPTTGAH